MMKRVGFLFLILMISLGSIAAAEGDEEYHWAGGVSFLAPGMPVAAKVVYQNGDWGWQGEANYFYILGMLRFDGRYIVKGSNGTDLYGFAGISMNHFNHYDETPNFLEFVFSADVGAGAEWRFTEHLALGIEGGLLIPFWTNDDQDAYDNSGLMVANLYLLYWF